MYRVEPLLSAFLYVQPQTVGDDLYFISNLGGRLNLYRMPLDGDQPERLLPAELALPNPHLLGGESYFVFPQLGQILIMLDQDGDENYQPMLLPVQGGALQPAFGGFFANTRAHCGHCDPQANIAYFVAESRSEAMIRTYRGNLASGELTLVGESEWGAFIDSASPDHQQVVTIDGYTPGDNVVYLWRAGQAGRTLLYGKPLEQRQPGEMVPPNAMTSSSFTPSGQGLLLMTALFQDNYGPAYLPFDGGQPQPVKINGLAHSGNGEMEALRRLENGRYLLVYNIDGCTWVYEAEYDETAQALTVRHVLVGQGAIANGMLESIHYDAAGERFALAFSTATSPTQIYTIGGAQRSEITRRTHQQIEGLPQELLSAGEDASYVSFDGTPTSARLYLPAAGLGFEGPRPVIFYIHGGPQSQERPDFAWFSMPLIQLLTLNGFAVFVPNVRGSSGYGLGYMKQVDRDWGGQDRLDHVHALQQVLPADARLDTSRSGVVGRSYGGYMTLTLAGRHPELWSAAVDMFGPYDLLTFSQRIPETWKPYFKIALGDPVEDRAFLVERSPRTHIDHLACPMLVVQGKNDPRVVEAESRDLVEHLRASGKQVEYLMFENEGHDVLKFENRVTVYNTITDFFKRWLKP